MATMADHAAAYAGYFHSVIPVGAWPGRWKVPLIREWQRKPLQTAEAARQYWATWERSGRCPNIGLVTGQISGGYIVLDLDRHEDRADGYEALRDWERENGRTLPETWTAITGGGGYHLFFHTDEQLQSFTNPALGVDLRAEGSQVVLPPSLHESGRRYQWEAGYSPNELPFAEADEAVMSFIAYCRPGSQKTETGGNNHGFAVPEVIPQGERTSALVRASGFLTRAGFSAEAIEAAIRAENESKCQPPLDEKQLLKEVIPAITRFMRQQELKGGCRPKEETYPHLTNRIQKNLRRSLAKVKPLS